MSCSQWETPDIEELLQQRQEEGAMAGVTTGANVGPYPVPLGPVLRRADVVGEIPGYEGDAPELPDAYKKTLGLKRHKHR
jgi:hypothetical protein